MKKLYLLDEEAVKSALRSMIMIQDMMLPKPEREIFIAELMDAVYRPEKLDADIEEFLSNFH